MTSTHVNPTGRTAVAKLANSQLTDQLEALGDVDLSQLNLIAGTSKVPIRDMLVDATITRTTLGASSLVLTLNDTERRLLNSGIFGDTLTLVGDANKTVLGQQIELFSPVDTEIDGLYFRLTAFEKAGDTLTLTFQDREVALLRSYPKKGDPHTYMTFTPPQTWTRIRVMRYLIQQVTETAQPIRIVSPMLGEQDPIVSGRDRPTAAVKGVNHAPGFPGNGKSGVTVKGVGATATQLTILEHVLDVGVSMGASRKLLVVAVMVATQESTVSTSARNGDHLGVFQQDSSPKSSWVKLGGGTGTDVSADAHAFFTVAKQAAAGDPGADYYQVAEDIQHSGQGSLYAQWRDEAENTVSVYLGSDQGNPNVGVATSLSSGFFFRGSQKVVGSTVVQVREDNWTMLQRLASEVGWACYCVSGTIYIEPNKAATTGAVRFQFNEDTDGVDQIDFSVNTSRAQAKATVTAHAKRWAAPPGSICQLVDMGPADGRWFVQTIARGLFNDLATITLAKPQPTLLDAESATPIQATQLAVSGGGSAAKKIAASDSPGRSAIVAAAKKAVELERTRGYYIYLQARPMPVSIFDQKVLPVPIDCSAFATLVYKAAGAPDPNQLGYSGSGNTATLWANGTQVVEPSPGDLVFYGTESSLGKDAPAHVAVYIGAGQIVNMGSPNSGEPKAMAVTDIPLTFRGYRSYPLTA